MLFKVPDDTIYQFKNDREIVGNLRVHLTHAAGR
jgi:hypothetical protein